MSGPIWQESLDGWGPCFMETTHGDYEVATTGDDKWWVTPPGGETDFACPYGSKEEAQAAAEKFAALRALEAQENGR